MLGDLHAVAASAFTTQSNTCDLCPHILVHNVLLCHISCPACKAGTNAFVCSLQHVEGTGREDSLGVTPVPQPGRHIMISRSCLLVLHVMTV